MLQRSAGKKITPLPSLTTTQSITATPYPEVDFEQCRDILFSFARKSATDASEREYFVNLTAGTCHVLLRENFKKTSQTEICRRWAAISSIVNAIVATLMPRRGMDAYLVYEAVTSISMLQI
jgi:hypothetical protein